MFPLRKLFCILKTRLRTENLVHFPNPSFKMCVRACVPIHFVFVGTPSHLQVSVVQLLIYGEAENFGGSSPSSLIYPTGAMYNYKTTTEHDATTTLLHRRCIVLRFDLYSGKAYPLSLLPNGSIFVSSDCKILLQGFLVMHVGSCKLQPSLKVSILE